MASTFTPLTGQDMTAASAVAPHSDGGATAQDGPDSGPVTHSATHQNDESADSKGKEKQKTVSLKTVTIFSDDKFEIVVKGPEDLRVDSKDTKSRPKGPSKGPVNAKGELASRLLGWIYKLPKEHMTENNYVAVCQLMYNDYDENEKPSRQSWARSLIAHMANPNWRPDNSDIAMSCVLHDGHPPRNKDHIWRLSHAGRVLMRRRDGEPLDTDDEVEGADNGEGGNQGPNDGTDVEMEN